ncbi:hypothetical protein BD289DRAFT_483335 [Coniella lustricola]|uniref:Uncharacterized protein n=1 Tax=Coniella lustricola TaxID=2025994 RepID=A0A2T3A5T2_9PEZI|nr:hypothetical protein BD289DRAFT_483335 [Coniella lustricola]
MATHKAPAAPWCFRPEDISLQDFQDALGRYEELIDQVSSSKPAKSGQKTLAELDRYRYLDAPSLFSSAPRRQAMQLEHIKTLVEWKLKHGKFRPTLMKLVTSNDEACAKEIVQSAVDRYKQDKDPQAAIDTLAKLKGVGPATASLLLAVHDPGNVIFFADEAFYWLCCSGRKDTIKYNAKECRELQRASQSLAKRLGVQAVDIERVAYVIMNEVPSITDTVNKALVGEQTKAADQQKPAKKRKHHGLVEENVGVRRSKRGRPA